ncbi:alpha/beta hydrolase [Bifidobacterium sp. ESL0704]|uniref:alpha/beta hydrolase n=1 Tax=Bifidobacterium sp. ESL0704 TaxID=2983219 RepID=UPI0023F71149|nr:alpha/beta hydrolase [Bifidobacterium sp. ESL0704]WEV53031.1 alpha/beta hydrolase [Bifidobacterium sp. ESL0704]
MAHISDEMIDPELRSTGKIIRRVLPYFTPTSIRWANMATRLLNGVNYTHLHYEQRHLRRPDGTDLRICIYRPKTKTTGKAANADSSSTSVPGILWIHGGGFALESPELEAFYFEKIVDATNAVLVAPDYRKSTEAPYPAALEDCYWTLLWLKDHAKQLGARPDQLIVAGASAGGNLTAAVSLLARDRKDVNIAFQVPICPMLDDRETPSSCDSDAPVWNTASNRLSWNMYLGKRRVTGNVPAYTAPARAQDLSGLPPTLSCVGDIEPFHDETVTYMDRLAAAGVETRFRVFPGAFHVFDALVPHARVSEEATTFLLDGFRYGIKNFFANQNEHCCSFTEYKSNHSFTVYLK